MSADVEHWRSASRLTLLDVLLARARQDERFLGYPNGQARFEDRMRLLSASARRAVLLALPLSGPMDTGFHAMFRSAGGDVAADILGAMDEAGFAREAGLMRHAMEVFGSPYPEGRTERAKHFSRGFHSVGQTKPDPPTEADRMLRKLDRKLGWVTRYAAKLMAFCEGDAELQAWLAGEEGLLGDEERLRLLIARAFGIDLDLDSPASADAAVDRMPEPFGQMFKIWTFQFEVQNGGIHQYFFNSHAVFAEQTAGALKSLGLKEEANALAAAIAMFAPEYLRDCGARRDAFFSRSAWSEWDKALQALTDRIDDTAITRALIDCARRHAILPRLILN